MSELVRVSRGVWRPREQVADLPGRAAALLSAAPTGTVIGGLAAARLHRLWLPPGIDERIELLLRGDAPIPEAHPGSKRRELRGRRRQLVPDEIVLLAGLPVTGIARTWVDLAEHLSMPDLVAAGDCALRCGASLEELTIMIKRAFHRRGVVRARAALPLLDARSRSRPESWLRYAIVSAGLPVPAVNRPIYNAEGEWLGEPDLSYDDVRLALEYNGAEHADPSRMRRDITREIDVSRRGGWRVVTFGPAEVFGRPDQTASYVGELRRDRGVPRPR